MLEILKKPEYEFYRFMISALLLVACIIWSSYAVFVGYPEARDVMTNWWLGVLDKTLILISLSGGLLGIYYLVVSSMRKTDNNSI